MKGKTTLTIAALTAFLLLAVVVFAPSFGDSSPDIGTPDSGNTVNSTSQSNYVDGNFTDAQSTNDVYFTVGRNNPSGSNDDLEAFINLTYNISAINLNANQILQMMFNISYCTTRDISTPSVCGGLGAQGTGNAMDAEIYNWSSGSYVDIGNIAENNDETNITFYVNRSFSDVVSNGIINIRYEANFTLGSGQDAVLSIDYAPLTVKFDNITPTVTLDSVINGFNTTAGNVTVNFTFTDNNATSVCGLIVNNAVNQTNSSTQNNTGTSFLIPSLAHGLYNWTVNCTDAANTGSASARSFFVNRTPTLASINDTPDPIKGGSVVTINSTGIEDPNNDTLNFYCAVTNAPTSANTICTGGSTTDTTSPYSMNCTFATAATDLSNTVFCRTYDGESYSTVRNTTYTTDSTQPSLTIANVSNDATAAYFDRINDGSTNITVNGESGMSCRFSTSDLAYSSMSNDCSITSTQGLCQVTTVNQGNYITYVSCRDSVGNEQNSTTNTDVAFMLDYTAPNTTDDVSSSIQMPGYNVTITENDNLDGDPSTLYCTDTTNACMPNTIIDTSGKVQFNSRGTYYLRYNSTDDAGNEQITVNKTIIINSLPVFSSAADNVSAVKGSSLINVSTVSSDTDSQQLTVWVCKTNSANATGCPGGVYCTANATANASCVFNAETDNTEHTWYAFIFDSLNESAAANSRSASYTTDSAPATATVTSPANTTLSQNSTTGEIVLNEAGDVASYCIDACSSNTTMTRVSSTLFTVSLVNLTNGAHTIVFYFNDTVGNLDNATKGFSVDTTLGDTTSPTITVRSPVNGTYYNTTSLLLNMTSDESLAIAQYSLNATVYENLSNYSGTQWNVTLTLGQGAHNVTFRANDTSGNRNSAVSSTISFFIDQTAPANGSIGFSPSAPNDTSSVTCFSSWTDNVALSYGFVEHNNSGSFVNTTNITLNGTVNDLNVTFAANSSQNNVGCRFYAFDKSGNMTKTPIITASVADVTVPRLENLTYQPNSTAHLDPGMRVNFTINVTDNRAISNLTVQYRLLNETNYSLSLMTAAGGTGYNGSVTFGEGNWTFRINATDASGNSNATGEANISVLNDDTYANVTTIPSIKSILLSERTGNNTLGNITLNNTADYNLNFTVIVTSPGSRVTLNGTTNTTFMIPVPRGNATPVLLLVNTTGLGAGIYNYSVYIEVQRNPVIGTENLTFQLNIQNSAGPLLEAAIETYSANTTLGQTIDLVSSVTNFGTSDATGVYLAWTLSENWTLASGNTTRNIGTLSPGIKATNSIRVLIGGINGTFVLNASANSTELSTDIDSKTVTVGTPITITQTETVSTPGPAGGGGGGAGVRVFAIDLDHISSLSLNKKETGVFMVNITNPNRLTKLVNVTLSIDGYSQALISINPEKFDIDSNKSRQFLVEIRAPAYIEAKSYALGLKVKASAVTSSITSMIEKTSGMSLMIHAVNGTAAAENVMEALKISNKLSLEGIESDLIRSYIEEAKSSLESGDYDRANELVKKIKETREKLSLAIDLISQVESKINEAEFNGLDISESRKLYELAVSALEREDYDRAIERSRNALSAYSLETRGKVNYLKLMQNWWWAFATAFIVITYVGFLTYRRLAIILVEKRLISLRREEISIRDLIDKLKADYFIRKNLGRTEYHKSIYEYETRLAKVRRNIIRAISKRASLFNFETSMAALQHEELRVTGAIKELQTKYFETGALSKAVYEKNFRTLKSERAEVLRAIEIARLRQAASERSILHSIFGLVRYVFNTPIRYQEKFVSAMKFGIGSVAHLTKLMPHRRNLPQKRFGYFDAKKGWNPEIGRRLLHSTKSVMYKFGPLFMIVILGFAGFASMNSIKVTGFATAEESALQSISQAQLAIDEMQVLGFGIERAHDTLKEAKLLYQRGNYSLAGERAMHVIGLKEKAVYVNSQIDEFDLRLYDSGLNGTNTTLPREIFNEAMQAFRNEQYESAENRLRQAYSTLSDIESEEARQRVLLRSGFDAVSFVKANIYYILASLAVIIILSWIIYRKLELKLTVRKLHRLEQEKEVTERMLRDAQQKYFTLGNWGKSDYETAKRRYEGRIIRLNREIATLRKSIPKLSKN